MMTLFITLCDRSIGPLPGSANQPANRANQTSRSTVHATDPVHVPSALTPTNPPPPPPPDLDPARGCAQPPTPHYLAIL
jgi:hypothetical protein